MFEHVFQRFDLEPEAVQSPLDRVQFLTQAIHEVVLQRSFPPSIFPLKDGLVEGKDTVRGEGREGERA